MNSNHRITRITLASLLLAGLADADVVTLDGGSTVLSGSVQSINAEGHVELASDLSAEPLLLTGGAVDRIDFHHRPAATDPAASLIELTNGDSIPASIESFENNQLAILSPFLGRLVIPRKFLHSIQTGINPHNMLYDGPSGPGEWTYIDARRDRWTFGERAMIANGPAGAFKDLQLGGQFILRFTMVWQNNRVPNFKIYFADPGTNHNQPDDRYYLQFGSAGLEVKREAASGKRYSTLIVLGRSHTANTDNRLNVELRVNREKARIELLLNGESEGEFADPIPSPPSGGGIAVILNHSENTTQEIRNIEALAFDNVRYRHRAEDRGDGSSDSLITRDDSRWTGSLGAIRKAGGEMTYLFKSGKQEEFMEIPEQEISTIFLAGDDAPPADAMIVLRLHREGSLSVNSCRFSGQEVTAKHPLLGTLKFRPGSIATIERINPPSPADP
jgi:hypothetical protein